MIRTSWSEQTYTITKRVLFGKENLNLSIARWEQKRPVSKMKKAKNR
jgi:hypothetical protein